MNNILAVDNLTACRRQMLELEDVEPRRIHAAEIA